MLDDEVDVDLEDDIDDMGGVEDRLTLERVLECGAFATGDNMDEDDDDDDDDDAVINAVANELLVRARLTPVRGMISTSFSST